MMHCSLGRTNLRFSATVRRTGLALLLGVAFSAVAGCNRTPHGDRVPLSGAVTKGGEPIEDKATIYFEPVDGKAGVGAIGQVAESRYSIPVESGPTPGLSYKVRLITAPGIPDDDTPRDQIRLPKKYETTVEIPARDAGPPQELDIDFE
jgi:hypothetical protein